MAVIKAKIAAQIEEVIENGKVASSEEGVEPTEVELAAVALRTSKFHCDSVAKCSPGTVSINVPARVL